MLDFRLKSNNCTHFVCFFLQYRQIAIFVRKPFWNQKSKYATRNKKSGMKKSPHRSTSYEFQLFVCILLLEGQYASNSGLNLIVENQFWFDDKNPGWNSTKTAIYCSIWIKSVYFLDTLFLFLLLDASWQIWCLLNFKVQFQPCCFING